MGKPSVNRFGTLPNRKPNKHRLHRGGITPLIYPKEATEPEHKAEIRRQYQNYREALVEPADG